MILIKIKRAYQIIKYALIHSRNVITLEKKNSLYQIKVFLDMVNCFLKYKMWTNQYLHEKFHMKTKEDRARIGNEYLNEGIKRDNWQKDFIENRKFLNKYTLKKYELPILREKRNRAYKKRYNMGDNCFVEYGVELSRQHYLNGKIQIGSNVLLAKNVNIDYSSNIIIGDDVAITDGVKILSHGHDFLGIKDENQLVKGTNRVYTSDLVICNNVLLGSKSIIMPGVNRIGINSIVSAGSVVTKEVPDNTIVAGNPAKKVFQFPEEMRQNTQKKI